MKDTRGTTDLPILYARAYGFFSVVRLKIVLLF